MKLSCKHCGQDIKSDDINLDRMVAKCWSCHAVFDFSAQLESERLESASAPAAVPAPEPLRPPVSVPLPDGITVERGDEIDEGGPYRVAATKNIDLRITRRWFQPTHIFMLCFACVWMAFLFFWYSNAASGDAPWIFFVFPLIHVGVGVGMSYGAITGLVNRTVITVDNEVLEIRHLPLPWPGNRTIAVAELEQLYCERHVKSNRGPNKESFTVNAVFKNNRSIKLLKGLPESAQALYIEKSIEAALGIADQPVPGEL